MNVQGKTHLPKYIGHSHLDPSRDNNSEFVCALFWFMMVDLFIKCQEIIIPIKQWTLETFESMFVLNE